MGAIGFASIEVYAGGLKLLAPTGIAVCDMGFSQWEYFGECPDHYAVVMLITLDRLAAYASFRVKRSHNEYDEDGNGTLMSKIVEFRVPLRRQSTARSRRQR